MSKKLAIRGHSTRGNEVIEILKMLGGKNIYKRDGGANAYSYYLFDHEILSDRLSIVEDDDFVIFTLEEFLEKYPFKVGDLKDLIDDHISCVISEMRWNARAECVEYHAKFGPNDYGWYKVSDFCHDYQIEEPNTVISGIYLNSCDYADEVELNLGDYEIEVRGSRTYAVKKKSKYPTTYAECCEILVGRKPNPNEISFDKMELCLVDLDNTQNIDFQNPYLSQLNILFRLRMCRDAYWKIAGEQMGLDEPWKHNYLKDANTIRYAIYNTEDEIVKLEGKLYRNYILCFPTEEMRDAFYENFKDLIESCKELL